VTETNGDCLAVLGVQSIARLAQAIPARKVVELQTEKGPPAPLVVTTLRFGPDSYSKQARSLRFSDGQCVQTVEGFHAGRGLGLVWQRGLIWLVRHAKHQDSAGAERQSDGSHLLGDGNP
jgi:hypothetical protein